jgi:DNA mismatch repair protein MutS
MNNFDENIINEGVCLELDEIVIEYENSKLYFEQIKNYLNEIMRKYEKNQKTDYIRIHETEKSGVSLQITNKRSILLIEYLKQEYVNMCNLSNEKIEYKEKMKLSDDALLTINDNIKIAINDVKFIKSSSTNVDIHIPILNDTIKNIIKLKSKINDLITTTYIDILDKMNPILIDKLDSISKYTANIDVLQNKVYVAKKYNYCKPIIDTNAEKSYVDVKDIRHCLIEHLQQNELYVTNDVKLGKKDDYNGILLYGTNAVGKTSLIRAIGVSIIMAQSGFYVPSTNFIYKPYTAIFSRILSNDNLFKGLSTFAVEMSELRVILKMSDENSLILGDELCSGTETQSAISIFLAGLNTMHVKESSFIFATHFHEIVDYEEINKLNKMILLHMEVRYNKEKNILEYDRKLKKGSGPKSYGLEVCKSLYLEDDFIDLAYSYRNKYFPDNKSTLMYDTTHYNKKKIKGKCEICKETISSEIHHLQHQEDADDNGFINTFHKNHKANLISICENCHKEIHKKDSTLNIKKRKKTTKGYVLTND